METVLELAGVGKTFRDFWGRRQICALADVDLALKRGEITALLGRNGAGKSTLMQICLGLLKPTAGRVSVLGGQPGASRVRRRIGFLPEESWLHGFLTARETLMLHAGLCGLPMDRARERTAYLLELVDLRQDAGRPVRAFSKGMARRLCLAQCLVGDPELIFLDEPTSGLDPLGTRLVKDILLKLKGLGRSILLSSHLLGEMEQVADAFVIIERGRVIRSGDAAALLSTEKQAIETEALSPEKLAGLRRFLADMDVADVSIEKSRQSLEAYFLKAIAGEEQA